MECPFGFECLLELVPCSGKSSFFPASSRNRCEDTGLSWVFYAVLSCGTWSRKRHCWNATGFSGVVFLKTRPVCQLGIALWSASCVRMLLMNSMHLAGKLLSFGGCRRNRCGGKLWISTVLTIKSMYRPGRQALLCQWLQQEKLWRQLTNQQCACNRSRKIGKKASDHVKRKGSTKRWVQ